MAGIASCLTVAGDHDRPEPKSRRLWVLTRLVEGDAEVWSGAGNDFRVHVKERQTPALGGRAQWDPAGVVSKGQVKQ